MNLRIFFTLYVLVNQSILATEPHESLLRASASALIANIIPAPEEVNQPYLWIKNRQLANGLVESAEGSNFVSLYDNALAAIVYTLHDDRESTEKILDYFDNRLETEFIEV